MVFGRFPPIHKDHQKQCSHGKINAGGIDRQEISDQGTDDTAEHPVKMIQSRNEEKEPFPADVLRRFGGADQSISLIGQRKDQVRFQLPAVLVTVQHGQTVEQMSCIDHQGQQNGRKKVVRCQKQRNCNKLHGAGVNEQAHKKCPAHMEAGMPFVS